jgi:hypothetical protein
MHERIRARCHRRMASLVVNRRNSRRWSAFCEDTAKRAFDMKGKFHSSLPLGDLADSVMRFSCIVLLAVS